MAAGKTAAEDAGGAGDAEGAVVGARAGAAGAAGEGFRGLGGVCALALAQPPAERIAAERTAAEIARRAVKPVGKNTEGRAMILPLSVKRVKCVGKRLGRQFTAATCRYLET